jgi:hypothetical protein
LALGKTKNNKRIIALPFWSFELYYELTNYRRIHLQRKRQLFGCNLYCQVSIHSSDRTRHARRTGPGKLAELAVADSTQTGLTSPTNLH